VNTLIIGKNKSPYGRFMASVSHISFPQRSPGVQPGSTGEARGGGFLCHLVRSMPGPKIEILWEKSVGCPQLPFLLGPVMDSITMFIA